MIRLRETSPYARSYLRGVVLDQGFPEPTKFWVPLPEGWGIISHMEHTDSELDEVEPLLPLGVRLSDLPGVGLPCTTYQGNSCIDRRCPVFYFEVFIALQVLSHE